MSANITARQVLARYSLWKTLLWAVIAATASGGILAEGWANGWRAPPGSTFSWVYLLGYGAAPFLFGIAMAMVINLVTTGGVAIARVGDQVILYLPFGRKRISLTCHVTVLSTKGEDEAPAIYSTGWFKPPSAQAPQVTFARAGQPDVNFRTGLLTETADTLAPRIAAAIEAHST